MNREEWWTRHGRAWEDNGILSLMSKKHEFISCGTKRMIGKEMIASEWLSFLFLYYYLLLLQVFTPYHILISTPFLTHLFGIIPWQAKRREGFSHIIPSHFLFFGFYVSLHCLSHLEFYHFGSLILLGKEWNAFYLRSLSSFMSFITLT